MKMLPSKQNNYVSNLFVAAYNKYDSFHSMLQAIIIVNVFHFCLVSNHNAYVICDAL